MHIQNIKEYGELYQDELIQKLRDKKEAEGQKEQFEQKLEKLMPIVKEESGQDAEDKDKEYDDGPVESEENINLEELDEPEKEALQDPEVHFQTKLNRALTKKELTMILYSTGHRQILVPSMGTTGKIFATHLAILSDLRNRIELLKQSYFKQQDKERTWSQVDKILTLLHNSSRLLDLPTDEFLNDNKLIKVQNKEGKLVNAKDYQELQKLTQEQLEKSKQFKKEAKRHKEDEGKPEIENIKEVSESGEDSDNKD